MHNFSGLLLLLVGVFLVAGKSVYERSNDDITSALKTVADGNSKFSFDLLKVIDSDKSENLVSSPLSLHVALGFLSQGAQGTTKQQILKATYLPTDDDVTQTGFRSLLTPLRSTSTYTLDLGDAAFIEKNFPITTSFQNVARASFMADTRSVDFVTNKTGAIDTINQWVKERTSGKIENLVSSSDVDMYTKFVLANTLYFKGTWENGFNTSLTKKMSFHVDSKTTVQTDMMNTTADFDYVDNRELDAKVLALNYKGKDVRMLIVLPNKVDGLAALESKITSLDQIKTKLFSEQVQVMLPKFKVEQELQYNSVLQKLGITDVFSIKADLSGISEADQLFVSQVKQKAVVEVNEEGTVAAAATEVVGQNGILTYYFTADHGFLYFLEHIPTSSVIMYGRYTKP